MARTVREIMNTELFSIRPGDTPADALNGLLALGITGAPVLGGDGHPLGTVSVRDLVARTAGSAAELMTAPAVTIGEDALIAEAGHRLAETYRHRLVVVDAEGRAIGVVSAVDVLRGLLGLPVAHPAAFPHFDQETRLTWTDDAALDLDHLELAPDGPGVVQLVHGGAGRTEHVVWVEACENVYTRLTDMLAEPQRDQPVLSWWLAQKPLRFRAALAADPDTRARAVEVLRARTRHTAVPS